MSEDNHNLRRSTRTKIAVRQSNDDDCHTPNANNSGTPSIHRNIRSSFINEELEKELETIEEDVQRPTELFTEEDVSANRYYGFRKTPAKNALAKRIVSNGTPGKSTPKELPKLKIILDKNEIESPKVKTTNKIITNEAVSSKKRFVSGLSSSESESVSEDSEFIPSDDDESIADDDYISENENIHTDDEEIKSGRDFRAKRIQISATMSAKRGTSKKTYSDFHLKTDEYFMSQSAKVLTSDRTLARLKNPRLNEQKLQELLSNQSHISRTHRQALGRLTESYRSSFALWYHIMEEGYSLLLHGLGSKRGLINDFYNDIVADHPTLIVNGFFPSLNGKDILDSITTEILELDSPTNSNECFDLIEETLNKNRDDRLYLLIHNIDAMMLRSNKAQDTLSRLAAIPNIRVLASVDHINGPLIWDNVKRSRFNFYWFDATTFMTYEAETSYESSLLVQHSGTLALSSLHNVFQSLTNNTKAIYTLLVKHQLDNRKNLNYPGMAFKDLYRGAREGFLVSSDLALRAQLIEFIDHKLVKTKRNMDGAEYLIIPLNNDLLQEFLDQQNEL